MAIAPYSGLKELIINMGKNEDFELEVEVGDLKTGVMLAKKALTNGTDIIISRGGTAELIQKEVPIPVIEIEISGYDMLRVLTLVKDYPGKIAIVGFSPIVEGTSTICEILNADISSHTVEHEEEVEPKLIKLKEDGFHVIIGDVTAVKKAEKVGLNGVLLTSGKESVLKAFQNAKKVYALTKRVKRDYLIPYSILQNEKEGIAVYDSTFQLVYSNPFYQEKISAFEDKLNIENALEEVLQKGEFQSILHIENTNWKVTGYSLENGSVSVVLRIKKCRLNYQNDISGVSMVNLDGYSSINIVNTMTTKNEKMKNTLIRAEKYCHNEERIWITGEKGTGKETLACYIHFNSSRRMHPFTILDCNLISLESWSSLLSLDSDDGTIFSINEKGTIFLKNIDSLPITVQKEFISYLMKNKLNCRFITSSRENISELLELGEFVRELYYFLAQLTLQLPSLFQRKEDIESLARIYINESNMKFGSQIVGIREEALETLRDFQWYGNIDQFRQVIGEIVLEAAEQYIENYDVEKVIRRTKPPVSKGNIDLTGTLEEIEQRIIKEVWLEEGMNKSRTAERLNINRTTLWRKLK